MEDGRLLTRLALVEEIIANHGCIYCVIRFCKFNKDFYFGNISEHLKKYFSNHQEHIENLLNKISKENCPLCLDVLPIAFGEGFKDKIEECMPSKDITLKLSLSIPNNIYLRELSMIFHLMKSNEELKKHFAIDKNPLTCITNVKYCLRLAIVVDDEEVFNQHKIDNNADLNLYVMFGDKNTENEADFVMNIKRFNINKNRCQPNKHTKKRAVEEENSAISFRVVEKVIEQIEEKDFEENGYEVPPKKIEKSSVLRLVPLFSRIIVGGRYNKFSREIAQSPWFVDGDNRVGKFSVEEILIAPFKEAINFLEIKFASAGREDLDVRMLGNGRPFALTMIEPDRLPTEEELKLFTEKINSSQLVSINELKFRSKQDFEFMNESADKKPKKYRCLIKSDKEVSTLDFSTIHDKTIQLNQSTPTRVLHRRAQKIREKIVSNIKVHFIKDQPFYFVLDIETQAGTYVKEFVNGDFGRTVPNVSSLLGCSLDLERLDVTEIIMDW